jgi:flagellar biosynthesis/type III secretory pathway M-ring protein FliF/YscJ
MEKINNIPDNNELEEMEQFEGLAQRRRFPIGTAIFIVIVVVVVVVVFGVA